MLVLQVVEDLMGSCGEGVVGGGDERGERGGFGDWRRRCCFCHIGCFKGLRQECSQCVIISNS